jgi:hypothetical protein
VTSIPTLTFANLLEVKAEKTALCWNEDWQEVEATTDSDSEEIVKNYWNYWGDNITYTLKDDVLTLSGSGEFRNDYVFGCILGRIDVNGNNDISEIIINDGITSISCYAFYKFQNLKKITIPDSVTSIGSEAFYGCSSLAEITIPDSATSIGRSDTIRNVYFC